MRKQSTATNAVNNWFPSLVEDASSQSGSCDSARSSKVSEEGDLSMVRQVTSSEEIPAYDLNETCDDEKLCLEDIEPNPPNPIVGVQTVGKNSRQESG